MHLPEGPARTLTWAILITAVGNGLYLAGVVLFLTRAVGLTGTSVGIGLSIAGLLGLGAGPAVGHLADRIGPRTIYLVTLTAEALATAALALVHDFGAFVVVATVVSIAEQGSRAVRGALIAQVGGRGRAHLRGYLRAVTNIGVAVGAAGAGLAIQHDTYTAYLALILADAVSFLLAALVIARIPPCPPVRGVDDGRGIRRGRLDIPYLGVTGVYGLLSLQYPVLAVVLPLWIVTHTTAPAWLVSPLLLTNTLLVVCLQIRAGHRVESIADGVTITRHAAVLLAGGCVLFCASAAGPPIVACLLLVVAVIVHTLGEIGQAAGEFELSFNLAPDHAQGRYQGIFGMGTGICVAAAPALLSVLCIDWGQPGWILLGGVLLGAGLAVGPAARWAQRTSAHLVDA
ncbi:MFS transporter [Nocardia jinanensis]|uniref:MFS transporter n=1 Tax=Nocardia jinanensis TaxID=382504 RepID=A0A917VK85_9NOCA|nr:MFS transporter [Nocardia jinanensis]